MIYLHYKDTKTFGHSFSFLLIFKTLRASYLQVGNFSYINTVRKLRNNCAHQKVLFDMTLPQAIGDGPCGNLGNRRTMLFGAYKVFKYLLGRISENRVKEMHAELVDAFDRVSYSTVKNVIFNNSGFRMNEI